MLETGDPVIADIVVRTDGLLGRPRPGRTPWEATPTPRQRARYSSTSSSRHGPSLVPGATGAEVFADMHARITAAVPDGDLPHHGGHALGLTSSRPWPRSDPRRRRPADRDDHPGLERPRVVGGDQVGVLEGRQAQGVASVVREPQHPERPSAMRAAIRPESNRFRVSPGTSSCRACSSTSSSAARAASTSEFELSDAVSPPSHPSSPLSARPRRRSQARRAPARRVPATWTGQQTSAVVGPESTARENSIGPPVAICAVDWAAV